MKALVGRVLRSAAFESRPPVLVDIGASGGLPPKWRLLAPHSVCIAFDADSRDFDSQPADQRGWRKLWLFNRLVTASESPTIDFYLTRSPHCSSSLAPDGAALEPWAFRRLFEVEQVTSLPSISLTAAMEAAGVQRIDWFKCDSQGTDLRLFRSLPQQVQSSVLAADFEPGIIDAYRGEDKLHQLMAYMDTLPFWVSDMKIKGSQRIDRPTADRLNWLQRRSPKSFFRTSPGWCEITYLHRCESNELDERDLLLAWVFATLEAQHGFAVTVARRGLERTGSALFEELLARSAARAHRGYPRFARDAAAWLMRRWR
jgi:hypothetical protein